MELRCTNCGALLARPPPPATTVRCNFCGAEQVLPQAYAPPPPAYTPPPAKPPPSALASGQAGVKPAVVVFCVAGLGMILLIVSVSAFHAGGHALHAMTGAFDTAGLTTLTLRVTPEKMAALTGAQADNELSMRVPLSGGSYDAVTFTWDKLDPTHVKTFLFYTGTAPPNDAAIRKRLQALLGRRLEKGESFSWGGAYLNYSGTSFNAGADPKASDPKRGPDEPHWADRLDALWDVARSAVLGLNVPVSDEERRDWLGGGYPLSAVGAIDIDADVDGAAAMMRSAFPGATSRVISGLTFDVPLDHPWFGEATFDWPNAKGGQLTAVRIDAPPGMQYLPNQADVEQCIGATYGQGKITSDDHLKGTHTMRFKLDQGEIRVDQYSVDLDVHSFLTQHLPKAQWKQLGVAPMGKDVWSKVIATLDACGRR
jgi:hypothetical protein